jgi:hypothetical protein
VVRLEKSRIEFGSGADEMQKMKCEVKWLSRKSARLVAFCLFQVIKEAIMWELVVIQAGARPDVYCQAGVRKQLFPGRNI